jgi:hypothetical protein
MATSTDPTRPLRPGLWLRRVGCLPVALAAAALLVGLLCGGWLSDRQPTPPEPAPSPPPVPSPGHAPTEGPAGPVPQPATTDPTHTRPGADDDVLPPDLEFADVAGVRLPASPSAGPRDTTAGLARGFSRDRAGAVLAAGHILLRLHPQVGADVFTPTLAAQVMGPDTAALRANVQRGYADLLQRWPVAYGQPAGELDFAVLGHRLDTYTDQQAGIRLLLRIPGGDRPLLGAVGLRLRWHGGDWTLIAPAGGVFATTALVDDPAGFTIWRTQEG